MKRLAPIAAIVCACAVACGSGSSSTTVVMRPANPLLGNVYVAISGAKANVDTLAAQLRHMHGGQLAGGFVVVPAARGPVNCTIKRRKVTLTFYGGRRLSPDFCRRLGGGLAGTSTIYKIPSSSMEPTLHCAKPNPGCRGQASDHVVVELTGASGLKRDDIVAFNTPPSALSACSEGGTFVKRIIGLSGETVREDGKGFIWIRSPRSKAWVRLDEPFVSAQARRFDFDHQHRQWKVRDGEFFAIGDNRSQSCDSRAWGSVPAHDVLGPVTDVLRGSTRLKPAGVRG